MNKILFLVIKNEKKHYFFSGWFQTDFRRNRSGGGGKGEPTAAAEVADATAEVAEAETSIVAPVSTKSG